MALQTGWSVVLLTENFQIKYIYTVGIQQNKERLILNWIVQN